MRKSKIFDVIIVMLLFITSCVASCYCGYKFREKRATKIVHVSFDMTEKITNIDWKYDFIDKDISDFIVSISNELQIDSDLVVAILMQENPEFDCSAIHKNENGTLDLGLGQLNSAFIYTTFEKRYWDFDFDLDPFNWKHNLFIVMHHIEYLSTRLKSQDLIIQAYNCGENAVMNNTIPASTKKYLTSVKNNLHLLKKGE